MRGSGSAVVREGVIAGVLGGVAVAAWFLIIDLVVGRLFYTPAALGSALFHGAASPEAIQVTAPTILGYTVIHFAAFTVLGIIFSALVTRAERSPALLLGIVLLLVTAETLLLGMVAIIAAWLLGVLAWWSIALANVLAAVVMSLYLWRVHPRLRSEVAHADDESLEARAGRDT